MPTLDGVTANLILAAMAMGAALALAGLGLTQRHVRGVGAWALGGIVMSVADGFSTLPSGFVAPWPVAAHEGLTALSLVLLAHGVIRFTGEAESRRLHLAYLLVGLAGGVMLVAAGVGVVWIQVFGSLVQAALSTELFLRLRLPNGHLAGHLRRLLALLFLLNGARCVVAAIGFLVWPGIETIAVADAVAEGVIAVLVLVGLVLITTAALEHDIAATEDRLGHEVTVDPLTGALNRTAFLMLAERAFAIWRRHKRAFTLLALDIDELKAVNLRHGRETGDAAIAAVAEACRAHLRVEDVVARFAGEEFYLVLVETKFSDAMATAERLQQEIRKVLLIGATGDSVQLTCAIGVASPLGADHSVATVMARADQAVAQAKAAGGNCVIGNDV
jgi:diguanylate cyclase (GGDEF)-like protein